MSPPSPSDKRNWPIKTLMDILQATGLSFTTNFRFVIGIRTVTNRNAHSRSNNNKNSNDEYNDKTLLLTTVVAYDKFTNT